MLEVNGVGYPFGQVADLFGQVQDATGQQFQGVACGPCRPGDLRLRQCGALAEQFRVAQAGQGIAELGISADQDALELVDGLGPRLDRGSFGQLEQPQHLHRTVARLRRGGGSAGQHRAGGGIASDELAKAAEVSFRQHPDAEILLSFPGLGQQTGARVLAEIGDDRARFADARSLKAYAGSAPITRASGKKHHVGRRMIKNNRLHHAGYLWAFSSLQASPGANAHYRHRREAGDWHAQAQRHLFNRQCHEVSVAAAASRSVSVGRGRLRR